MNDARLLNRLLWSTNLLLGVGILLFSFQYRTRASDTDLLKNLKLDPGEPPPGTPGPDPGDGELKSLPNPMVTPRPADPEPRFKATLKGTLPSGKDPKRGVAFIQSTSRNVELVAYVDEEIRQEGKVFDEYRGWVLTSAAKDRAIFSNRKGETVDLVIDPSVAAAPGGTKTARIDKAYTSETYKSRLLASLETRQVWGLDPDEIDWAGRNAEQILDRDFQVAPYAGGGLRLESVTAGSIGAARGLIAGDVLRQVNGQALNSIGDVRTLLSNSTITNQSGLKLTIERAGKPIILEYRPLPR